MVKLRAKCVVVGKNADVYAHADYDIII